MLNELLLVDDLDDFDMKDPAGDGTKGYVLNRDFVAFEFPPVLDKSAVIIISGSAVNCEVVK